MRNCFVFGRVCFLVIAATTCSPTPPAPLQPVMMAAEPTTIRSFDGRTMAGEVIPFTLPQRRAGSGANLVISALRLPSTAANPGNPIVFLMGGPGIPGSAMVPIPPYFSLFQRLRENADVIVVDQRGIGNSVPVLDCPITTALPEDLFENTARLVSAIRDRVSACAAEWRAKGYDPVAFNTLESADDIDDIRRALGAPKIDLLAFSYGTRLALAYVHRHGRTAGRVVLQGVNGPGLVVKRPAAVNRKLERISAILARDSLWSHERDLLAAARKARARLDVAPAIVTITDRRSGQPMTLRVGRAGFDAMAALSLDDPRLPALIVSTADGDNRLLTIFAENGWNGLNAGTAGLMARAVNCAADRPRERWQTATAESETAAFGALIDNAFLTDEFCAAVGHVGPTVEFDRTLRTEIPFLMLTGTLDATNPTENARDVARFLPNAIVLDIENARHEALTISAVQDLVVDFFRGSDVRGRSLSAPSPNFPNVADALKPAPLRR